jgi:hypothetical protein
LNSNAIVTEYELKQKASIPSDGNEVVMRINETQVAVDFVYKVAPKISRDVFFIGQYSSLARTKLNERTIFGVFPKYICQ